MLVSFCALLSLFVHATPAPAYNVLLPRLEPLRAGVDYPTDLPQSQDDQGKQVLQLGGTRIRVTADARLVQVTDDLRCDYELAGALQVDQAVLPLCLQRLWVDQDSTAVLWVLHNGDKVALADIYSIECAQADLDFPADPAPPAPCHAHILRTADALRFDMGDGPQPPR